jgi:hypothetical protein
MSGGSELLPVVPAPGRLAVRRGRRRRGVLYREASDERIEVAMQRPSPAWLLLGPAAVGASAAVGSRPLAIFAAICAAAAPLVFVAHRRRQHRLVLDEGALEVHHRGSTERIALYRLRGLALLGSREHGAELWALRRGEPDLLIFRGPTTEVRHVERLLAGALERDPASQARRLDGDD